MQIRPLEPRDLKIVTAIYDEAVRCGTASFELDPPDEGEMVRYLRMVVQLLRELRNAPHASEKLHALAAHALPKINRDVVDAEKQLRV